MLNNYEKRAIFDLKEQGNSYREISEILGINISTIKSFCSRHKPITDNCKQCGVPVRQTPHRKHKDFCCDKCRITWWNHHPKSGHRTPHHTQVCAYCHKTFNCYRAGHRVYCSRTCYNKARSQGGMK